MVPTQPNIVLITVDSLRADHLGCYGYIRPTSPNIDDFAQEGLLFTHAFSNGPNTPHAFPAIMASRDALISKRLGLFDAPLTLAEVLKAAGYATVGFNAANPYCSRAFHYHRGFEQFHDYLDFAIPPVESEGRAQESLVAIPQLDLERYAVTEENIKSKACLESQINSDIFEALQGLTERPFFLWIHYMDTHYPYLPQFAPQVALGMEPISKEENFALNTRIRESMGGTSTIVKRVVQLYDGAIRQLDAKVGELLDYLRHQELYESSLIILSADHGEEFLEHGDFQHKSKLFDELIHVPLIVKFPHCCQPGVRHDLTSLIQLPPAILSVGKIDNPFAHHSFFADPQPVNGKRVSAVFAGASYLGNRIPPGDKNMLNVDPLPKIYSCRDKRWKLIRDTEKKTSICFDLVNDPSETEDVDAQENARLLEMQERIEEYIAILERARLQSQISRIRKHISSNLHRSDAIRLSFRS